MLAASAGLLFGAYGHRVLDPTRRGRDWLFGVAATIAAVAATSGIALLQPDDERAAGIGCLIVAAVYVALAAGIFSRDGFRNSSTILWTLGLVLLLAAEALIVSDAIGRSVVIAATSLAVAALARPLREMRLWLAGGALAISTTALVLGIQVQPWLDDGEIAPRLAIPAGACAFAALGHRCSRVGR